MSHDYIFQMWAEEWLAEEDGDTVGGGGSVAPLCLDRRQMIGHIYSTVYEAIEKLPVHGNAYPVGDDNKTRAERNRMKTRRERNKTIRIISSEREKEGKTEHLQKEEKQNMWDKKN